MPQIAVEVELSHTAVSRAIARYEPEGMVTRKRGRRQGGTRVLMINTASQHDTIGGENDRPVLVKLDFKLAALRPGR